MVFFPNADIRIFREMPHGTPLGVDDNGNPVLLDCGSDGYDSKPSCLMEVEMVVGDFQPQISTETTKDYGHSKQSKDLLNLDLDIDIRAEDKVKIIPHNGKEYKGFFQVIGDPLQFTTLIPHLEVSLTKERVE